MKHSVNIKLMIPKYIIDILGPITLPKSVPMGNPLIIVHVKAPRIDGAEISPI